MNKFNNSISVNIKVKKSSYSSKDLTVRKRAAICNRSTLFFEKSLDMLTLSEKSVANLLFTRRGGINGIFKLLTNVFKIGVVLGSLNLTISPS